VRPETKLVAFLLLIVAVFLGARAAGEHAGPVTSVNAPPAGNSGSVAPGGGMGGMNMGPGHK
jgi:hypothetical protein